MVPLKKLSALPVLLFLCQFFLSCTTTSWDAPQDGIWDNAGTLSEGLVAVQTKERWGYTDANGNLQIAPQFAQAEPFSQGKAAVMLSQKWGFIDHGGRYLVPPQFLAAGPFSQGLAPVKTSHGWGFIDESGKMVIPAAYDEAGSFHEGLAAVKNDQGWGFIDREGRTSIEFQYRGAGEFSNGKAPVATAGTTASWGYINPSGQWTIKPSFTEARSFAGDRAAVLVDGQWGFIDQGGKLAINPRFEAVGDFSGSLAPARQRGLWGLVSTHGEWVLEPRWAELNSTGEGWFSALQSDGQLTLTQGSAPTPLKVILRNRLPMAPTSATIQVHVTEYLHKDRPLANVEFLKAIGDDGPYDLGGKTDAAGHVTLTIKTHTRALIASHGDYLEVPLDVSDGKGSYELQLLSKGTEIPQCDEVLVSRTDEQKKESPTNVLLQQEEFERMKPSSSHVEIKVHANNFPIKKYFLQQKAQPKNKILLFDSPSFDVDMGKEFAVDEPIFAGVILGYMDTPVATQTFLVVRDPAVLKEEISGPPPTSTVTQEGIPFMSKLPGTLEFVNFNRPPINFKVKYKDDKISIFVGVSKQMLSKSFKEGDDWENDFKSTIDKLKSMKDNVARYAKNVFQGMGQDTKNLGSGSLKASMGALGYIDLKWDRKDQSLKVASGYVIVFAEVGFEYTQHIMVGFIPVYATLGVGGKLTVKFAAEGGTDSPVLDFFTKVTFNLEPYVDLEAGVGIKGICSVGMALRASIPMEVKTRPFSMKGSVLVSFFLRLRALVIFSWEIKLKEKPFDLFNTDKSPGGPPAFTEEELKKGLTVGDSSYLSSAQWLGSQPMPGYRQNEEGPPVAVQPLKKGIMPGTEPQIVYHDGRKFIFWVDGIAGRPSSDNTVLMFTYEKEDKTWATEKRVWDNGTGDYEFSVAEYRGKLYVAWQKANKAFNADWSNKSIEEVGPLICASSQIVWGEFSDTEKGFKNFKRAYGNDSIQGTIKPRLTSDGDRLVVSFVQTMTNDYFMKDPGFTTVWAYEVGKPDVPLAHFGFQKRLISYDCLVHGGQVYLVSCEDEDGSLETINDRKIVLHKPDDYGWKLSYRVSAVTDHVGLYSNPRALHWKGEDHVFFYGGSADTGLGNYYHFNLFAWFPRIEPLENQNMELSEDFALANGPNDSVALVYVKNSAPNAGEGLMSVPQCIVYNEGAWSPPVAAWTTPPEPGKRSESVRCLWVDKDSVDFAYRSLPSQVDSNAGSQLNVASLQVVPDLKIISDSLLRYYQPVDDGATIPFSVEVQNTGLATIHGITTDIVKEVNLFSTGEGKVYKHLKIKPGETVRIPMEFRRMSYDGRTLPDLMVSIQTFNEDKELYTKNNYAPISLLDPELRVHMNSMVRERFNRTFSVGVENRSCISVKGVTLQLYDGDHKLKDIPIGEMNPYTSSTQKIDVDIRDLKWDKDPTKMLRFEVSSPDVWAGAKRTENYAVINPNMYWPFSFAILGAKASGKKVIWVSALISNLRPSAYEGDVTLDIVDGTGSKVAQTQSVHQKVEPGKTVVVTRLLYIDKDCDISQCTTQVNVVNIKPDPKKTTQDLFGDLEGDGPPPPAEAPITVDLGEVRP